MPIENQQMHDHVMKHHSESSHLLNSQHLDINNIGWTSHCVNTFVVFEMMNAFALY